MTNTLPDERETYTVSQLDENIVGLVWDALRDRAKATMRDGSRVIVGVPLCQMCDQPVSDGPCGCMRDGQ